MLIVLNPHAGGGTAQRRWRRIEPALRRRYGALRVCPTADRGAVQEVVADAVGRGERLIVAAGGDGTMQAVLQALCTAEGGLRADVCLGAVALGSSNDLHKPMRRTRRIGGVHCLLDEHAAPPRDVGVVRYETAGGGWATRYWLLNGSAGVTAEGNAFFNRPDAVLAALKARSAAAAILYAALRTTARHRARRVCLLDGRAGQRSVARYVGLTNLAILKSPFCSGSLRYGLPFEPASGRLRVHVCEDLSLPQRLRMLAGLARGRTEALPQTHAWQTDTLSVEADAPFAVEYDGEVVQTRYAHFSLAPWRVRLCT